jgi:hypothetical protein
VSLSLGNGFLKTTIKEIKNNNIRITLYSANSICGP